VNVAVERHRLARNTLRHYIEGDGIEVGALHSPLDLSGLAVSRIRYVDRMTRSDLERAYPELKGLPLTEVDVVDDGEQLNTFAEASLDFVIGNHFMEHTRNPIGTIRRWLTRVKPGGVLYLALPDYRYTFDKQRPLTPLEHLVEDDRLTREQRAPHDREHFVDWGRLVNGVSDSDLEGHVRHLLEIDYSIHFHTFTLRSFLALLDHMQRTNPVPFTLKACADVLEPSDEFITVLQRLPQP
jgi:predicted SAM-dependent methyltransferase